MDSGGGLAPKPPGKPRPAAPAPRKAPSERTTQEEDRTSHALPEVPEAPEAENQEAEDAAAPQSLVNLQAAEERPDSAGASSGGGFGQSKDRRSVSGAPSPPPGGRLGGPSGGVGPGGRMRGSAVTKPPQRGEVRYPIIDVEPVSPRITLSERSAQAWQERLRELSGAAKQRREVIAAAETMDAPLDWYADELADVCGSALVTATARLLSLQTGHLAGLGFLEESQPLWGSLSEITTRFAAAAYHVQRAAVMLLRDVANMILRRGSSGIVPAQRGGGGGGAEDGKRKLPSPPFPPRRADEAIAALHIDVTRLQTWGPQLATALRRLTQGMLAEATEDVKVLLGGLPAKGSKGAFGNQSFGGPSTGDDEQQSPQRFQMLLMVVPCIEEAVERLATLVSMVERSRPPDKTVGVAGPGNAKENGKAKTGNEDDAIDGIVEDDGGGFDIFDEDSQELRGSLDMSDSPQPSSKASARPASGRRKSSQQKEDAANAKAGNENSLAPPAEAPTEKRRGAGGDGQLSPRDQRNLLAASNKESPKQPTKGKKKKGG